MRLARAYATSSGPLSSSRVRGRIAARCVQTQLHCKNGPRGSRPNSSIRRTDQSFPELIPARRPTATCRCSALRSGLRPKGAAAPLILSTTRRGGRAFSDLLAAIASGAVRLRVSKGTSASRSRLTSSLASECAYQATRDPTSGHARVQRVGAAQFSPTLTKSMAQRPWRRVGRPPRNHWRRLAARKLMSASTPAVPSKTGDAERDCPDGRRLPAQDRRRAERRAATGQVAR